MAGIAEQPAAMQTEPLIHIIPADASDKEKSAPQVEPNISKEQLGNQPITRSSRRIKQKRRHNYQTQDLLREISPQPEDASVELASSKNGASQLRDQLELGKAVDSSLDAEQNRSSVANTTDSAVTTSTSSSKPLAAKRTVQCNICKRRMTESKLANHIRLLHVETEVKDSEDGSGKRRKEFRCEYCGKCYAIKYTYDQHLKTHTEGRPKCPECGSTFASAFSLFRHRAKSHNLEHNYTTHTCDQCDKIFFSVSELALHQQRHSSRKDHVCPECKKAFSVKGNLRIHMRTHAKEKLYKCDICDNSFSHPYSLVSHRRIHTNEFPYQCDECGKTYRSKHQLTSHQNVHSDDRPFKCDLCSKTFRSRTAFKMHQDQHKGIKRFACKDCGRKFQCHANKLKHERRHKGDKRHKCEICEKAFIEKQELRNHQKVHDKQNLANEKRNNHGGDQEKREECTESRETKTIEPRTADNDN